MLIMLEGPDGAGKSTLAAKLQQLLPGSVYEHHGAAAELSDRELSQSYMRSLRKAFNGSLIMDRGWLSEPIYAEVYRQKPSRISSAHQRMLERAALQLQGVVVRCLPPFEVCAKAFASRDEMLDNQEQLRQVYDRYRGLRGHTELPVVPYDHTTGATAADVLEAVRMVKRPAPRVTLIGERPATQNHWMSPYLVPFVSFTGRGCSEWLADQLAAGGILETDLEWFNAYAVDGTPLNPSLIDPASTVIALGRWASAWCRDHGVSHRLVSHPQAHRRFHGSEPYPLITILKELLR